MNAINPELVLSQKKMKSAARRLNSALAKAGVESDLNYAQSLNALSKTIFGIAYEEVLATLFTEKTSNKASEVLSSVYLVDIGSNTLLVVDGQYESSTNSGSDLEISKPELLNAASTFAARKGVEIQEYTMPEAISALEFDQDRAYVDIMHKMGFFRPEGSIFYHMSQADIITIDGMSIENASFMDEHDFDENGLDNDAYVWNPVCSNVGEIENYELVFTFGDLCNAKKEKDYWNVYSTVLNERMVVRLFKSI